MTAATFGEWSQSLALIGGIAATAQLAILCVPYLLISLFYTRQFDGAASVLPLQLIGDFFYLLAQPCLGALLGLSRRKEYLALWIVGNGAWALVADNLLPRIGLLGVSAGYIACNALISGYCILALRRLAPGAQARARLRGALGLLALSLCALLLQAALFYRNEAGWPRFGVLGLWVAFGAAWILRLRGPRRPEQPLETAPSARAQKYSKEHPQEHPKEHSVALLLNGTPLEGRVLEPLPGDDPAVRGYARTEFIRFSRETSHNPSPRHPHDGYPILVLDDCICQNDYELLRSERRDPGPGFVVLEDQGNLIWGWTRRHAPSERSELRVGGLILNKPHFWPSLMRKLGLQHQVCRISGVISASSPVAPFVCGEGAEEHPRSWVWVKPDARLPLHVFLPDGAGR